MSDPAIWLVNPPTGLYRRDDRCQSRVEDQTVNVVFPPMELAQYAAVARERGWAPTIRDHPAERRSWDDCRREIESAAPDVLLVNTTTATAAADLEAAAFLKRRRPDALTLARGEYLRYGARDILEAAPQLDAICWGEFEAILPELLELRTRHGPRLTSDGAEALRALPGLAFFHGEEGRRELHVAAERPAVADLDALPLPARDLLDHRLYRSPETGRPITVVQGNRGCPSKCIFCPAGAISGYRVRFRSPTAVVAELVDCVENHGIREFLFNGDTFTIKKSWVLELCGLIREAGLDVRWGCNSRVDTMDDERARALASAGCWVVAFGIESGSQTLLDKMGKNASLDKAVEAVRRVQRAGMRAHTFYIVGLPWETRETLEETLAFARRLDADFFDFNVAYPLPGTELWEIARRDGLFEGPTPSETSYAQAALRTYELSGEELTRWRRKALLSLYLRPTYIARTLWRARSPRKLWRYVTAALRRLRSLAK